MQEVTTTSDTPLDTQHNTIDIAKALQMRLVNKLSYQKIGDHFGVSKQAVHERLNKFMRLIDSPDSLDTYRNHKAQLIESAEMQMLNEMLDPGKIKKTPAPQLATMFGILYDKVRIERNQMSEIVGYVDIVKGYKESRDRRIQLEKELGMDTQDNV